MRQQRGRLSGDQTLRLQFEILLSEEKGTPTLVKTSER